MANTAFNRRKRGTLANTDGTTVQKLMWRLLCFRLLITESNSCSTLQALFKGSGNNMVEVNCNQIGKISWDSDSDEILEAHTSKISSLIADLADLDVSELLTTTALDECAVGEYTIKTDAGDRTVFFNQDLCDATVQHLQDHTVELPLKRGSKGFYEIDQSRSDSQISSSNTDFLKKSMQRIAPTPAAAKRPKAKAKAIKK